MLDFHSPQHALYHLLLLRQHSSNTMATARIAIQNKLATR